MMFVKVSLFIAALSVSLAILMKGFIYPDCYSFDSHDDANHAFPGLHVARSAILSGELPTINYFNNFGSPLLGDGLTYPLAIQSLTYYFLENPLAMTLNRFFISLATVTTSFWFFRIYLGVFPALVCAVLIFFNPVAFWYPVHQYQMASLFFFAAICCINHFYSRRSAASFVWLCLLLCVLILSVSINLVVLMGPLFLIWGFCRNRFRFNFWFLAYPTALAVSVISFFPQTLDFVRNFRSSGRVSEGVYGSILTSPREWFLGIIVPPSEWLAYNYGAQAQVTSYISAPVLMAIVSGAWLIHKKAAWIRWSLFLCGGLPTLLAFILYVNTSLRFSIPLLKSVDISRVFWFSMPFCYVYVGYFIGYCRSGLLPPQIAATLILGSILTLIALRYLPEASGSPIHAINLLLTSLGAVLFLFRRNSRSADNLSAVATVALVCSFVFVQLPVLVRVLGLNSGSCSGTQYSNPSMAAGFTPSALIDRMERGNRLATEIHTHRGQDLRAASYGILGSAARAIVVDRKFGKYLEKRKLVTVDQIPYGYYFSRPWQTIELGRLGIRYLLVERSPDLELESKGWKMLERMETFSLYENPVRPTPVYLLENRTAPPLFVRDFRFFSNSIRINLPEIRSSSMLIVTILLRPGFQAEIDGREAKIVTQENGFIGLQIHTGDRIVSIKHQPFTWMHVIAGAFIAALLTGWYARFIVRSGKANGENGRIG